MLNSMRDTHSPRIRDQSILLYLVWKGYITDEVYSCILDPMHPYNS